MRPTAAPVAAWRAQQDGVGHAFVRRHAPEAYCGAKGWPERFDWPVKTRCPACVAKTTA